MPRRTAQLIATAGLLVMVAGCGGPGSSKAAPSSSAAASTSYPAPTGPGCSAAGDIGKLADKGLVDALAAMPATTQFAAYAKADPARAKKLNALSGVTAFVPVDAAWGTLDEATVAQLGDPAIQAAALEYSIVAAVHPPKDVGDGKTQAMPTFRAAGVTLTAAQTPDGILVNGAARVNCSGVPFAGGLIYLTDKLLLAPA